MSSASEQFHFYRHEQSAGMCGGRKVAGELNVSPAGAYVLAHWRIPPDHMSQSPQL
jgi:hypothetical protein